ncbi:MAG: rRNA pseudouridine synthase [Segetibacter sp.]|nr:rRNA pseudouridine synthase [Segetibacter sp.]
MVSQFVSTHEVALLKDIDFNFPEGTHAIGRLDNHSEGLLILTTNKKVTKLLFQGEKPHKRTYLVQVKNIVSEESLQKLRTGVSIHIRGGVDYTTTPCEVDIVQQPENLFTRSHQLNNYEQYSWLSITLTEGKFHQVRKMVDEVKHRCVRLIRTSIEDLELGDLQPGCIKEIEENYFFGKLKIDNWH